jgi:hypothetical protein
VSGKFHGLSVDQIDVSQYHPSSDGKTTRSPGTVRSILQLIVSYDLPFFSPPLLTGLRRMRLMSAYLLASAFVVGD